MRHYLAILTVVFLAVLVIGCTRTEPESAPTAAASQDHIAVSKQIIDGIARDIEGLKVEHEELVDFSILDCVKDDHLSLHYTKNVVGGVKGTQLGRGKACEIVVKFSTVMDHGISPIPWGNYEIVFPNLGWQVSSFPACYWIPGKPGDGYFARFGGRFVRSDNLELCRKINEIVRTRLRELKSLEKKGH